MSMKIKTLMLFIQILCIAYFLVSGESSYTPTPPGMICQIGGGICPNEVGCRNFCKFFNYKNGGFCIPPDGERCCCKKN